jgi:putative two-component system response regulator
MKILIAEDDLVSRTMLARIITDLGYEVLVAESGQAAFQIWKNERPKLVISDWVMPAGDGIELCNLIRENEGSQYTYIIIVTSKNGTEDIVKAIDAGADDFVSKPYIKEELAVRIRAGIRVTGFESRDLLIFSLAKLAESRDTDTGYHLERIRYYSKQLAQALAHAGHDQINNVFIDNIFLTSPLHDIGKVGIPDTILLKPGRLDDEEFTFMKTHCQIGYTTLNEVVKKYPRIDYLVMSANIALYHHEKYNGSGYPHGLAGEDIPLAARIVALADVYDALISKRVYKEAFTHENARSIIISDKGTHFDPLVVEAFHECEKNFFKIAMEFKDNG